jgi:hypothetical protein
MVSFLRVLFNGRWWPLALALICIPLVFAGDWIRATIDHEAMKPWWANLGLGAFFSFLMIVNTIAMRNIIGRNG